MITTASDRSFRAVLDEIRAATRTIGLSDGEHPWYRGQGRASDRLEPSLFRAATLRAYCGTLDARVPTRLHDRLHLLRRLESDTFFEFTSYSRHSERTQSAWDTLFLMRHYGLPTRTLDWSETLGTAVFFAVSYRGDDSGDAAVWLLNPYGLNETNWGVRDTVLPRFLGVRPRREPIDYDAILATSGTGGQMPFARPVAVYPDRRNERMHAQTGNFTVHGQSISPLDRQRRFVRKVLLPADAIPAAKQFLDDAGINERTLFPGIEGLSMELRRRYFDVR